MNDSEVRLLDAHSVPAVPDDRSTRARISDLYSQVEHLTKSDQSALISEIAAIWALDQSSAQRDRADSNAGARTIAKERSDEHVIATLLIKQGAEDSQVIGWYVQQFGENEFMMDVLWLAARITVKIGGE